MYGVGRSTRNDGIESHQEPQFARGVLNRTLEESELVAANARTVIVQQPKNFRRYVMAPLMTEKEKCTREDSNLKPSVPKTDALSN